MANPPFKGSLDADTVSADLLKVCKTKKTELLCLALFLRMLHIGGRCACIVPDGGLVGSSKAHQSIRKELIENHQLRAVISMPSGVFTPYAGVSTAVLVFTKPGAGGEIQLTDAMAEYARNYGGMTAVEFTGKHYDMGNKLKVAEAQVELALQHPEIGEEFRAYLKEFCKTL